MDFMKTAVDNHSKKKVSLHLKIYRRKILNYYE